MTNTIEEVSSTTIDFLRHGHCEGGEIFRGSTDVSLSEKGWQQMQARLDANIEVYDTVVCSPLKRCRLFARQYSLDKNTECEVVDDLRELHFGEWEGREVVEVQQQNPELLKIFWHQPTQFSPPGAEPISDFQRRVSCVVSDLLQQYQGRHILVVAHGAVMRMVYCLIMGLSVSKMTHVSVAYAGMMRFCWHHKTGEEDWPQLIHLHN